MEGGKNEVSDLTAGVFICGLLLGCSRKADGGVVVVRKGRALVGGLQTICIRLVFT